ncbi:hypothetical protein BOX15_Mlig004824g1 [Macrostomum lignano]|uniref:Uncharacterized protein n=1 Tax=Macrostomum lignano TaxID=282301 RepID=A0A267EUZ7_9PLAT|nr:hypothetical protein BOX15_Mlig004824g1 [Macrostomum lignano]
MTSDEETAAVPSYQQEYRRQLEQADADDERDATLNPGAGLLTERSVDSNWDDNRTDTTALDGDETGGEWDCFQRLMLPPVEAEDLIRPSRQGPDRQMSTGERKPRRFAICHSQTGFANAGPLLKRQDSAGSPPLSSLLLVKYYDTHDRLGVFDGHEGSHHGDQCLNLEPGSQFVDLCVSNRYKMVYLVDQENNRIYGVDLTGQLQFIIAKRLSSPLAACMDDRHSMLFVLQRRKVRLFQVNQPTDEQRRGRRQRHHKYIGSIKSNDFRNLASADVHDGRLWLADSQADQVHVYAYRDTGMEPVHIISLQNPICVSLDASGSAFIASGEPLHQISVYEPEGTLVGSFGGWGSKPGSMKLPIGVCAYQLSHLVDKRMVAVCCFGEHKVRMYALKNLDTSVI